MVRSAENRDSIPVEEVAKTLGTTPLNVLLFIKRGQLKGREEEGQWLVDRDSFAAFMETPAARIGSAPCRSACSKAGHCGSCDH
ncbi:MAG: hypothetical protein R2940_09880 [Syntrophotaleaceae bacterium]